MIDDEKFFAWLDGELEGADAAEVEALVAADPRLAALAEQHRTFGAGLRAAFDPVVAAPLPQGLRDALSRQAEVVDLAAARERRSARGWSAVPQWAAMAATLAIGIVVGTMVGPDGGSSPVQVEGGKMYAAAGLDQALDRQLASASDGPVRVGLTFRDGAGSICRSFTDAASSGLACREGEGWRVRGLFAAPEGQSGEYRMAAGTDTQLAALIEATIAGEPFDAAHEQAAQKRGWR